MQQRKYRIDLAHPSQVLSLSIIILTGPDRKEALKTVQYSLPTSVLSHKECNAILPVYERDRRHTPISSYLTVRRVNVNKTKHSPSNQAPYQTN